MSESQQAVTQPAIRRLNPPTLLDATDIGNTQISVVSAGSLAFVAGQTATPLEGESIPEDLAGQARIVATRLAAALKQLGASARDVVTFRLYIVNATTERFQQGWSPIHEMLQGEMPSATAIGVQALWTPDLQIEVEMTVRMP